MTAWSSIKHRVIPWIAALSAGTAFWFFGREQYACSRAATLVQASVQIAAITVGFLANLKATLFSISERSLIVKLRNAGYYDQLVDALVDSIRTGIALAVWSTYAYLGDFAAASACKHVYLSIWLVMVAGPTKRARPLPPSQSPPAGFPGSTPAVEFGPNTLAAVCETVVRIGAKHID